MGFVEMDGNEYSEIGVAVSLQPCRLWSPTHPLEKTIEMQS